jgi:ATP-dependent Clp protease ATP-binding subunit ClpB
MESQWPAWLQVVRANLPARPQIVLSGNVRDVYRVPRGGRTVLAGDILEALWLLLESEGYEGLLVYDRLSGLSPYPVSRDWSERVAQAFGVSPEEFAAPQLPTVAEWMRFATLGRSPAVAGEPLRLAFVVDYASRLARSPDHLEQPEHELFHASERLANSVNTKFEHRPSRLDGAVIRSFNPIIWIVNRERDLPIWFVADNPRIASQVIPSPMLQERRELAETYEEFDSLEPALRSKAVGRLADLTDGLPLFALPAIRQMARNAGRPLSSEDSVREAVRLYKLGVADNPWGQEEVRRKLADAEVQLPERIKGQDRPIREALDRLKRSALGLSGAHAGGSSKRPRAVLMLAGPTGVGKTELARAVSNLLFGTDECIRFDMSEFSTEHTDQRLIGAPPGYVGYDAGGELTNAVRTRPFSVLLFDEIEKAHPRILDKFLQILEDGRLTDSHGVTTYFSECVILFTTNKGVYGDVPVMDEDGRPVHDSYGRPVIRRERLIRAGMSESEMSRNVTAEIERYFREDLGRPEIMNRIGPDNVIVFNPIGEEVAVLILKMMLERVRESVRRACGTRLTWSQTAFDQLLELCRADLQEYGGRGIGNNVEIALVNPLARILFDRRDESVHVNGIVNDGSRIELELGRPPPEAGSR